MISKKLLSLSILATLGAVGLAGCGGNGGGAGTSGADQSQSAAISASGDASSSSEDLGPQVTSFKFKPAAVNVVGDVIDLETEATISPAGSKNFSLEATKGAELIKIDGHKITLLEAGQAKIRVSTTTATGAKKSLVAITINIFTEEAGKIQKIVNGLNDQYAIFGTETVYKNKKIADVTETDMPTEVGVASLVVNPKYMLDWCYGELNGVELDADGNYYTFSNERDAEGNPVGEEIESFDDLINQVSSIAQVDIGERGDDYRSYFDHTGEALFNVNDLEEVMDEETGDITYEFKSNEQAGSVIGGLYFMDVTSWTNGQGYVRLVEGEEGEDDSVYFCVGVDTSYGAAIIEGYLVNDFSIAGLDKIAAEAPAPEKTDVTDLEAAFAALGSNFTVEWTVGAFNKDEERTPLAFPDQSGELTYDYAVGRTLVVDDMLALAYTEGDKQTGTFDWNAAQFGSGVKYASTVMYDITETDGVLSYDEEAGTEIPVATTDFTDFRTKVMIAANGAATKELLEDAFLAKSEDGTTYTYTPSFDNGALATVISSFVGLTFTNFLTEDYLPYLESTITLLEDGDIGMELLCRTRFDEAGLYSGYQGYIVRIHNAGQTSLDLSKSFAENFGIEITPETDPTNPE